MYGGVRAEQPIAAPTPRPASQIRAREAPGAADPRLRPCGSRSRSRSTQPSRRWWHHGARADDQGPIKVVEVSVARCQLRDDCGVSNPELVAVHTKFGEHVFIWQATVRGPPQHVLHDSSVKPVHQSSLLAAVSKRLSGKVEHLMPIRVVIIGAD
jgi:hypothetical protein